MEDQEPIEGGRVEPETAMEAISALCAANSCTFRSADAAGAGSASVVSLKAGREHIDLNVGSEDDAKYLQSICFWEYTGIPGYFGLANYDQGTLELLVELGGLGLTRIFTPRRLERLGIERENPLDPQADPERLIFDSQVQPGVSLTFGFSDQSFSILHSLRTRNSILWYEPFDEDAEPKINRYLTIKITGLAISRSEDAVRLAEEIGGAFLFQFQLSKGQRLALALDRQRGRAVTGTLSSHGAHLGFPRYSFDQDPLRLYLYAANTSEFPMLQYLAYYQVVEYFFPIYSEQVAQTLVRHAVRDPGIIGDDSAAIARLIKCLRPLISKGRGSEREAIAATIQKTVTEVALSEFLGETKERVEYFSRKGVSDVALTRQSGPTHVLENVLGHCASRIYDIRCKAVHAKADELLAEEAILMPFSKEWENMRDDFELIRFIAQRVLLASGKPLSVPAKYGGGNE